ncbi:magnesium chelatase family protein [Streptosporangium becharense]|uniref:Magnesium chelatase family protein n=1 Tax=Streptosporangium becharense TaxID=1816182 RepID=A0A7W9MG48_9ACTN|nr:YifB family Mg chelatase-like AAA ATPase [Streptosporangium becharense]MBB2910062.1 magnesium chelatase family protein [Streptosporangium becharense]MBB5818983.1 magnesium chelatase family protein [Streptosporangium becharense]
MTVARTRCIALVGVTGHLVEVEADIGAGMAGLHLIGMLDTALSEARDRVRSALVNSRCAWPDTRITVSLFPASLPKRGSMFDVAIAVALLAAAGVVPVTKVAEPFFLGELGLDGTIRPVRGVLPAVLAAVAAGARTVVVPVRNAAEAALVPDVTVVPVASLSRLTSWLRGDAPAAEWPALAGESASGGRPPLSPARSAGVVPDLGDVAGQPLARRALEVCAAGGHNLWMLGPPGTGKTMLAERLPTLLPDLEPDQALEVTAIHSVAGALPGDRPLLSCPPFVAPHHTATVASVIGGGSGAIRPGAVSLAHRGVLFLDEAPEFPMTVLDALRQPLESGQVVISRALGSITFPARFMLVLAANRCPCARPATPDDPCGCSPAARRRYLSRLSGPLLDRVDVKVTLYRSTRRELLADRRFIEPSRVVAERVLLARERAAKRFAHTPWRCNAEIPTGALHGEYRPARSAMSPLLRHLDTGRLSARGLDRVLRLAWTLADLGGKDRPEIQETTSALGLWLGED